MNPEDTGDDLRPSDPAAVPAGRAILVVESNALMRDYLQHRLRARFPRLSVVAVDSERDALFHIVSDPPQLIFVHVRPGDGRGFELLRRFRRVAPAAKVVFLSDCDWPEYREEALRCGADHYLEKGAVRIDDILALVRAADGANVDA